jgi:hypothetical protein
LNNGSSDVSALIAVERVGDSVRLAVYEPAIACQQAQIEEPDCLGGGGETCPLNEALQSDCLLLLGEEQRQSVEGCAPEEEEEFP